MSKIVEERMSAHHFHCISTDFFLHFVYNGMLIALLMKYMVNCNCQNHAKLERDSIKFKKTI